MKRGFVLILLFVVAFVVADIIIFTSPDVNNLSAPLAGNAISDIELEAGFFNINLTTIIFILQGLILIAIVIPVTIKYIHHKQDHTLEIKFHSLHKRKGPAQTELDTFYSLIKQQKGKVSVNEAAKLFKISNDKALEWAKILENENLIDINYPLLSSPEVCIKSFGKVEEKGKTAVGKVKTKTQNASIQSSVEIENPGSIKYRNPGLMLFLSTVTLGVFTIYWFFSITKEVKNKVKVMPDPKALLLWGLYVVVAGPTIYLTQVYGVSGALFAGIAALLVILTAAVVSVTCFYLWKFSARMTDLTGMNQKKFFALWVVVFPIAIMLVQKELNKKFARSPEAKNLKKEAVEDGEEETDEKVEKTSVKSRPKSKTKSKKKSK